MAIQTGKKISVFGEKLRGMQDQANDAMANYRPGGVRVPDGIYTARQGAEIREAKSSGKLMISRQFTVSEGEFKGLNVWDNLVIQDNPTGIQIARRWVEQHGFTFPEENFAEIETIVNEIGDAGSVVKVRVKTTPSNDPDRPWVNCDVLEVIDGASQPDEDKDAADPDRPDNALTTDADDASPSDDDLISFCASQGVEGVEDGMERDDIVAKMSEYTYQADELTAEEIDLLKAVDLEGYIVAKPPVAVKAAPKAAAKPAATPAKTVARSGAKHFGKGKR